MSQVLGFPPWLSNPSPVALVVKRSLRSKIEVLHPNDYPYFPPWLSNPSTETTTSSLVAQRPQQDRSTNERTPRLVAA